MRAGRPARPRGGPVGWYSAVMTAWLPQPTVGDAPGPGASPAYRAPLRDRLLNASQPGSTGSHSVRMR